MMSFMAAFEKHLKDFDNKKFLAIFAKQIAIWTVFVFVAALLLRLSNFPPAGMAPTVIGIALIALTFALIYSFELYVADKYEHIKHIQNTHYPIVEKKKESKPLLHIKIRKAIKPKKERKSKGKVYKLKIKKEKKKKNVLRERYRPVSKDYFKK